MPSLEKQKVIRIPPFGVEVEFQIVDPKTFQLSPKVCDVISQVPSSWHGGYPSITSDVHKCILEGKTAICKTLDEARQQLQTLHRMAYAGAKSSNVLLCGGGVHPFSDSGSQPIIDCPRYNRLRIKRGSKWENAVVFGLHVHVGISAETSLFRVFNTFRYVVPNLIALTANSPFWQRKLTTYASNRLRIYSRVLTVGLPPVVENWAAYEGWMRKNSKLSVLKERDIYWDIRPRKTLGTLEVRFMDMPYTLERTIQTVCIILGIIAAINSVGASWLNHCVCTESELQENRSVAIREGMSGSFRFFGKQVRASDSTLNVLATLEDLEFEDSQIQSGINAITQATKKGQTFQSEIIDSWRERGNEFEQLVASLCTSLCDFERTICSGMGKTYYYHP